MTRVTDPLTIAVAERWSMSQMIREDLSQVMAMERDAFPTPWTEEAFLVELKAPFCQTWVALDNLAGGRSVAGYVCFWQKGKQIQVANLCVRKDLRRQGLGRLLMKFVLSWAGIKNAGRVSLEVRENNLPAFGLYQSLGFEMSAKRKGYYTDTGEDALVMELGLGGI